SPCGITPAPVPERTRKASCAIQTFPQRCPTTPPEIVNRRMRGISLVDFPPIARLINSTSPSRADARASTSSPVTRNCSPAASPIVDHVGAGLIDATGHLPHVECVNEFLLTALRSICARWRTANSRESCRLTRLRLSFTFTFTILRYEAVAREPEGPLERSRNKFMLCRP